jgi:hypothetical protein
MRAACLIYNYILKLEARFLFNYSYILTANNNSFRIATRYWLEGPEIEFQWGEIFRTYPDRLRGPSGPLYNGYRVFPEGKGGRDVMLTTHHLLVPRLRKS